MVRNYGNDLMQQLNDLRLVLSVIDYFFKENLIKLNYT